MIGERKEIDPWDMYPDMSLVTQMAERIVADAKQKFSDQQYKVHGKSLDMHWLARKEFLASASVISIDKHRITLSYGAAVEMNWRALMFSEHCIRVLSRPFYDEIYNLLHFDGRREVLPDGYDRSKARAEIIIHAITWLYAHEQSHLFQAHGEVAKAIGVNSLVNTDQSIAEIHTGTELMGRDAAARHAFELSADYEAISMVLAFLAAGNPITVSDLWFLTASLVLMFQSFDNGKVRQIQPSAIGTHPHPAFRIRIAQRHIQRFLVYQSMPVEESLRPSGKIQRVMEHATFSAALYWHFHYYKGDGIPDFIKNATSIGIVPSTYAEEIFDVWNFMRPHICSHHFGPIPGWVMRINSPADLM